ncbi:MAG: NUDIX hydrolase [Clostridiales bacterium]|nr:NUDIX hydrolase [Clostridiales bacterium]
MSNDQHLLSTTLSQETVYNGMIIDVAHVHIQLPNGNKTTYEAVLHKGAAAVVPVDDEDNIYLVKQHRPVADLLSLEIPAGKLDYIGEPHIRCAERELQEETGLRCEQLEHLTDLVTTPAFCTEVIGMFLATGLSQHENHLDDDEFIDVIKMPLSEAVNLVMTGQIRDSKTIAGVLMAWQKLHGPKASI